MFRRNQSAGVTKISANPLCYYAVSFWTNTERLLSHPTQFILLDSTAENELGKGLVLFPAVDFIDAICKHMLTWTSSFIITYFILCIFCLYLVHFLVISFYAKPFWSFVYFIIHCAGAGITTLISISDGLDAYFCPSKDGKDAVYDRKNGRRGAYFPPESSFFLHR